MDEPEKEAEPDKNENQSGEANEPAVKRLKESDDIKTETESPKPMPVARPVGKSINEPPHEKTNNVVFDQVRHKRACAVTEEG